MCASLRKISPKQVSDILWSKTKPSIIFVSTSEDYARFRLLCKHKGLSNARLFSHILNKFPCGKHMLEFDELPIDSSQVRFGLLLSDADIKKLDSLCKIYGVKRPLMFKILLSWYYNNQLEVSNK